MIFHFSGNFNLVSGAMHNREGGGAERSCEFESYHLYVCIILSYVCEYHIIVYKKYIS